MTSHLEQKIEYYEDYLACLKRGEIEPEPWRNWQNQRVGSGGWYTLTGVPWWPDDFNFRRKPVMCSINGHEFPEPMRVAPAVGTICWDACTIGLNGWVWKGGMWETMLLKTGLIQATKQGAADQFKAIVLACGGVCEGV